MVILDCDVWHNRHLGLKIRVLTSILAPAHAHEAFQLVIRLGDRRIISENFATEFDALILIWRGLAISLACVMGVLMKLPARTMHSFAGGGDRVKPIGATNSRQISA